MRKLFLAVAAVMVIASGTAIPATAQSTPPAQNTTTQGQPVMLDVGEHVTVHRYWYENGEFHIVLSSNIATLVSVTDSMAGIKDSGGTTVPFRRVTVDGQTEVVMDVTEYRGGAAVSVGTSDGLVRLSTGVSPANPFAGSSPTMGWLGGGGIAILSFIGAGIWVIRKESGEPEAV
mgnify:CR=1 FL=1